MRFFTYAKQALSVKAWWQKLRFATGKGYYLTGTPPATPKPAPAEVTMYDSIDVTQIPANAAAVAGYVGGNWPTYPTLAQKFPHAYRLSIAVNAGEDADCLDIEQGDATITDAPAWVKRQLARGLKLPALYTSLANADQLERTLLATGLPRTSYRLFTAHYTYKPHRCTSVCGFGFTGQADATQYDDHALGRNLDASLCAPNFFQAAT